MDVNKKIIDLLFCSVISEGGDGDALWLSKHTPLDEVKVLITEYDIENNTGWSIENKREDLLIWGRDQEAVFITNKRDVFDKQPSWIILKIDY